MILPFVFDMEQPYGTDYDHLSVFYFYVNMILNKKGPIIAHERYFSNPNDILKIENVMKLGIHHLAQEMQYKIPSCEELNSIGKYCIPQNFEDEIISEYKTQRECWKDILLNENLKFTSLIDSLFNKIETDYNDKIEAVLCFYCPASLKKIADIRNIPVIFNERTSFRPPLFISMGYFDTKESYGTGELETRYNRFKNELPNSSAVLFERKEILSIFMTSYGLNYLEYVDKIKPVKELGICNVDPGILTLIDGLFSNNELYHTALKKYLPENIAFRNRSDRQSAFEFILSCKRIASVHSNMSFDTMLLGRISCSYGASPFAFMANKGIEDENVKITDIDFINFVVFGYFVPWNLLRNEEYIRWRLSKPSEIDIYNKHLDFILKTRGLELVDLLNLNTKDNNRLCYILSHQNVHVDNKNFHKFIGDDSKSYILGRNVFDCDGGVLFENFEKKENWGVWSNRKTCTIKFIGNEIAFSKGNLKIVFVSNTLGNERLTSVIFNGVKLGDVFIPTDRIETSFMIPKNIIKLQNNILEFSSQEELRTPKELGINDDERSLAIGFSYIKICDCELESQFDFTKQELEKQLALIKQELEDKVDSLRRYGEFTRQHTLWGLCARIFHKIVKKNKNSPL